MGVTYEHYLIPEDDTYRPGPEELARLVNALCEAGFAARAGAGDFRSTASTFSTDPQPAEATGCYVQLGDRGYAPFPCPCLTGDVAALGDDEFKLVWPVGSTKESGLKYPLVPFPEWGDAYYDLEIRVARDFVYCTSEGIDPFDEVKCACGLDLEYNEPRDDFAKPTIFYDARIHRTCPSCGEPFHPRRLVAQVRDGRTGEATEQAGGATYIFSLVVDCGKGFAREGDWPIRASEEFLGVVTRALGQRFYEIGTYN